MGQKRTHLCGTPVLSSCASLGLAMALAFTPAANARDPGGTVSYQVKRGDTLITLADRYLKNRQLYRVVQRQNRISAPKRIPIGKTLRISRSLLKYKPATARLVSVRGSVLADGKPLKNGDSVREGMNLSTAASSFATVQLGDGSRVSLPSNSSLRVRLLRRYKLGNSLDYDFAVLKGGARSKVSPLKSKNDRYRVRSPKAVSAVRGTDFNVRFDPDSNRDFAEVEEGGLGVRSGTNPNRAPAQALPSGKGLAVAADGRGQIDTLLPPPEVISGGKTQSKAEVTFETKPQLAERGYRYTLSSDAGFTDIVSDQIAHTSRYTLGNLDNGSYFMRVRAIARSGLQGLPATFVFKRRLNDVKLSAGQTDDGFMFKWTGAGQGEQRYHFQLIKGQKTAVPMIDRPGLAIPQISISELPPGNYFWRIGATLYLDGEIATDWSEFEKISLSE